MGVGCFVPAVWLKGKADDFYRAGDFRSAANAYSSAIDADSSVVSCYSNRAACFLALGELPRCVEDCDAALEMLPAPEDVAKLVAAPDPHPDQLRWHRLVQKVLVRRGTALCRMGKYEEALRDYKIASELKPDDEALLGDVQRIERLIKCTCCPVAGREPDPHTCMATTASCVQVLGSKRWGMMRTEQKTLQQRSSTTPRRSSSTRLSSRACADRWTCGLRALTVGVLSTDACPTVLHACWRPTSAPVVWQTALRRCS